MFAGVWYFSDHDHDDDDDDDEEEEDDDDEDDADAAADDDEEEDDDDDDEEEEQEEDDDDDLGGFKLSFVNWVSRHVMPCDTPNTGNTRFVAAAWLKRFPRHAEL